MRHESRILSKVKVRYVVLQTIGGCKSKQGLIEKEGYRGGKKPSTGGDWEVTALTGT